MHIVEIEKISEAASALKPRYWDIYAGIQNTTAVLTTPVKADTSVKSKRECETFSVNNDIEGIL